jgi:dihydropteroate synthase
MTTRLKIEVGNKVFQPYDRTIIMGIINTTPDSFSDGGLCLSASSAAKQAIALMEAGAEILDVGGESSRPFSEPVPAEEEKKRVVPAIREIRNLTDCPISIDTRKASVAEAALDAGADMVNDITALEGDPDMMPLVRERGVPVILMHMKGSPEDMQKAPFYTDVVREIDAYLEKRIHACLEAGIEREKIIIDPGIGFGKRLEDNLDIINNLKRFKRHGVPLLTGVSRKAFIGSLTGVEEPGKRDVGTAGAVAACVLNGSDICRVHNPAAVRDAVMVAEAIRKREIEVSCQS